MNKVRVTICGKEYALKTEESASYFYALAKKVETEWSHSRTASAFSRRQF